MIYPPPGHGATGPGEESGARPASTLQLAAVVAAFAIATGALLHYAGVRSDEVFGAAYRTLDERMGGRLPSGDGDPTAPMTGTLQSEDPALPNAPASPWSEGPGFPMPTPGLDTGYPGQLPTVQLWTPEPTTDPFAWLSPTPTPDLAPNFATPTKLDTAPIGGQSTPGVGVSTPGAPSLVTPTPTVRTPPTVPPINTAYPGGEA